MFRFLFVVPLSLALMSASATQPASAAQPALTGMSGFSVGLAQECVEKTSASQRIEVPMLASTVSDRVDPFVRGQEYHDCIVKGTQVNVRVTGVDVVRDSMNLPRVRISVREEDQLVLDTVFRQNLGKTMILLRNGKSAASLILFALPKELGIYMGGFSIRAAEATRTAIIEGK